MDNPKFRIHVVFDVDCDTQEEADALLDKLCAVSNKLDLLESDVEDLRD